MKLRLRRVIDCKNLLPLIAVWTLIADTTLTGADYEIGGPLEGPKLPLFPTEFGEEPGYPGCMPNLQVANKPDNTTNAVAEEWTAQGQWPQRQLYPGSVENWRAYWFKYAPVRAMVDAGSLLKNWVAPAIPGGTELKPENYAAPIYYVPRHKAPKPTGRFNKPVPVLRCEVRNLCSTWIVAN